MSLKPEVSVPVALATAALVYGIHMNATPSVADIRSAPAGDSTIDASERSATWLAAATVAGISLVAKDPTVFVVGGAMVIGLAWWTRHANEVNPLAGVAGVAAMKPSPRTEEQGAYDNVAAVA